MTSAPLTATRRPGTTTIHVVCADGHHHTYDVLDLLAFRQQLDEAIDRTLSSGLVLDPHDHPGPDLYTEGPHGATAIDAGQHAIAGWISA